MGSIPPSCDTGPLGDSGPLVGLLLSLSFLVDRLLFFSARRQSTQKATESRHGVFEAR